MGEKGEKGKPMATGAGSPAGRTSRWVASVPNLFFFGSLRFFRQFQLLFFGLQVPFSASFWAKLQPRGGFGRFPFAVLAVIEWVSGGRKLFVSDRRTGRADEVDDFNAFEPGFLAPLAKIRARIIKSVAKFDEHVQRHEQTENVTGSVPHNRISLMFSTA